jgi:DNA repair exonuclease SbcCD ATPase subunit
MILFTKIRYKNFLSTGNAFTEIILNETPNALIIGENGAGKSTLLDALCFALFGKAFRNINKGGLVNSVNEKGLVTEIEFTTANKSYKVIRGIKPNVFEIWCDGICLNQDSTTKDYQEHLEKFILKMTFKSFTQIVILGSASFKPFMQLTPADRRIIIEDLLDIQIFSVMNTIVKMRSVANKEATARNRIESTGKKDKLVFVEKTLNSLKQNNELKLQQLKDNHELLNRNKIDLTRELRELSTKEKSIFEQTQSATKLRSKLDIFSKLKTKIDANADRCAKNMDLYHSNDSCPTCKQNLDSEFIKNALNELSVKSNEYSDALNDIKIKMNELKTQIEAIDALIEQMHEIRLSITSKNTLYESIITQMLSIEKAIAEIEVADELTLSNEKELEALRDEVSRIEKEKERLIEERLLIDTAIQLLKDGGIKTKIIKQYLPIINKQINKYLSQMGFFVNFNIDESFNETIKSRYRDEFSYQNFSEGEKQKIDLALLFTWRTIAKMRNSASVNLLIFDEIFDSSLDQNGVDSLMNILRSPEISQSNIFVISHRSDAFVDKFDKVHRFTKKQNFSVLST